MNRCAVLLLLLLSGATLAWTQDQSTNTPVAPTAPLYNDGQKAEAPQQSQETLVPDDRPITGAEVPGLGWLEGSRNLLVPALRFSQTADTNPGVKNTSSTNFGGVSVIGGSLQLQRKSLRNDFSLRYDGGATFYEGDSSLIGNSRFNTSFHNFGISDSFAFGRWTVTAANETSYSPEALFGYGVPGYGAASAISGAGLGNSLLGLEPYLLPNQNILTQRSSRISNTTVGQLQYNLSRRTSITTSGSYGLLRFPDGEFLDGDQFSASVGLNHSLTSRDTVAVSYGFGLFRFGASTANLLSHSFQLSYARRVTGRLSWLVHGGSQLYGFDTTPSNTRVGWTAGSSLQYNLNRTGLHLAYNRSVNGGSGVLLGARGDTVSGGVSHPFGRSWTTSLDGGYSHNSGLRANLAYDSEYVNVSLYRKVGRYYGLYFNYNLQRQTTSVPCAGCSDNVLRHVFGVGFDWRFRPIRLD